MDYSNTSLNLALFILHFFLGAMIFAHGYNKIFRGGKLAGTASWFDSIGMRPGTINAYMAAATEVGAGLFLMLGLLMPLAAGALIALMTVAIVTVHRKNGFFVFNKGQGIEYCLALIVASIVAGAFGGGKYSCDYAMRHVSAVHWLLSPTHAFVVTVAVGFGGAALQLAAVYRPPKVS